jgi:hypothetical protein
MTPFVVRFKSRPEYGRYTCFQEAGTLKLRMLRSTRNPALVARWDAAADARAWLASAGLSDGDIVPVGIGWMTADVVELDPADLDPTVCRGALFEVPPALMSPVPVLPERGNATPPGSTKARPAQAAFAFD